MEKLLQRLAEIAELSVELEEELSLMLEGDYVQDESDDLETRIKAVNDEKAEIELRLKSFELRRAQLEDVRKTAQLMGHTESASPFNINKDLGDVYDLSDVRGVGPEQSAELRARALTAIERTADYEFESAAADKASRSKERVTYLVEHSDDRYGNIAKLVLATNSPVYKSAWLKAVTDRKDALTTQERQVLDRAMSLTDGSGGFAVPMPIDPTLIQLGDGAAAGIRQYARQVTITNDVWKGLASTQMTASWDAEGVEVSDDTTTFTQPTITPGKAAAFVPASIEIAGDYPNLVADLGALFADAKFRLEATAFATGTGSGQPKGLEVALDTESVITSTTTDVFAIGDVYRLFESVGPRYRTAGAGSQAWASNISILNLIRQFGTANNYHGFTVDLTAGNVPAILGRPWFEMSGMDGTITALANNFVLVFGDFSSYVIVDRVGFTVEYIPHLFHVTTNLPSGSRGWYAYWRTGADVVNVDALTILNVT